VRYLYILAVYLAAPLISLVMLWRGFADRIYWASFPERFGFGERLPAGSIWIHAVSVGEVNASAALVTTLRERYPGVPVLVTDAHSHRRGSRERVVQGSRPGAVHTVRSAGLRTAIF